MLQYTRKRNKTNASKLILDSRIWNWQEFEVNPSEHLGFWLFLFWKQTFMIWVVASGEFSATRARRRHLWTSLIMYPNVTEKGVKACDDSSLQHNSYKQLQESTGQKLYGVNSCGNSGWDPFGWRCDACLPVFGKNKEFFGTIDQGRQHGQGSCSALKAKSHGLHPSSLLWKTDWLVERNDETRLCMDTGVWPLHSQATQETGTLLCSKPLWATFSPV